MPIRPDIWVINLEGLFRRAVQDRSGVMILKLPEALAREDLDKIADARPLIVCSPSEHAQSIAKAFSAIFKNAEIVTNWLLQCDYDQAYDNPISIWESVDADDKESYQIAIFIPEP